MIFDSPEANQRISDTAAEAPPATFMERFQAADKQGQLRGTVLSPGFAVSEDYDRRIKDIKDAGLGDLTDLNPMWNSKPTQRAPHVYSEGHSIYDMEPAKAVEDPHEAFQKKLEELAQKYPDKAHIIKADKPITGSESYQAAKRAAENAASVYGGPPLTGPIADFAGGMWSMRKDPFQIGTLAVGPMSPVRQGAKAVLTMGLKQAAANAAVEATMQPFVQSWRKSMNDSYGWWDAAEEIGMAGAFGLGADAGVRMLYRGVQARMGRKAILDEQGRVTGYESGAAAAERDALNARNLEIQKNLEALPKDTLDKVAQGDEEATIAFAKALKADEDPSVAGAINALRNTDRVTLDGIDDGWRERSLLQQLRSLEDPSEPAPAHFDSAAKAERPRLADDAELPKGTEGNQHYRMLDLDGKPVRFEAIDANRITTEPETFQFKGGRDAAGASNALRAVDFDGTVKGKVIVYEREDGSLVVADGHDRVSLANRAPEPQKLDALIFREKDGWTPDQVRAEAARKNIQEGTGSLMDVAGAIRRHPEIVDDSMAVSTDFMADARSIARLSDDAFDAVAGGQFNPKHGVMVSDLVPDQARHVEVLRELDRRNPPTEAAARREIGNMLREPANIETLTRVMGIPLAEPHVIEARNDVLAGVMTTLRQEPGYIGEIETQAVAAVIRRLSEKPGLVSDVLAQAGRAVAEGQPIERAIDATLRRFEDVIGKAGVKGLADQPVRLSPTDDRPRFLAALAGSDAAVGRSMRADLDKLMEEGQPLFALSDLAQRHSAVLLDDVGPNDPAPRSVLAFHGTNAEAAFDKLALPSGEFGVHFGTTKQSDYVAKKFGNLSPSYDRSRIMPSVLTTRRVLTMDDLVGWFADDIALEIGAAKRYDAEFPGLRNDVKGVTTNEQLRAVFAKHQIDAVRYQNAAEGDGWSYLVWDNAVAKSATSGADIIGKNITPTKIAELAENLRQALDEATTPPPGRLDDPIKDAPKQVERLREDLAEDIAAVMPPKLAAAEMPKAAPANGIPSLLDLYQRYSANGREALDAVMPGTGRMIDEFVQANPEVVSRIAEALGAPTGRQQAAQMLEQAMPQFMSPRVIDMSKPVLLTPEANARMREIRTAIDETVKMLPPEYRIRVEDSLVFNFGDGDKRLDGLHDGYEKLIYVSMAAGDPVRTSRHEVIHALRQSGLMKDEEFAALYKFADRLGLRKAYEIDTQYKEPYTQAYGNRGADFVEQLLREETVANMFSDYSLNGRRFGDVAGGGMVDRLIDMIVTFMKQVRDIMGGYGFRNVYDVFESIESGAMARRGMGDAPEASRLAAMSDEPPPLARDLADVQRDRDGHDVMGACRA